MPATTSRYCRSFSELCIAMQAREAIIIEDANGRREIGYITGIRLEDGSGHNWLVTIANCEGSHELFIRTAR